VAVTGPALLAGSQAVPAGAGLAAGEGGEEAVRCAACAPATRRLFRDVHGGSGGLGAGVALVVDHGYCFALAER